MTNTRTPLTSPQLQKASRGNLGDNIDLKRNILLVDCENVGSCLPEYLVNQHQFDHIALFVGSNQKQICIDTILLMQRFALSNEIIRVPMNGNNALDFVLSAEAGKHAHQGRNVSVLSNDHGFDAMIVHLKEQYGINAKRLTPPKSIDEPNKPVQKKGVSKNGTATKTKSN
jgi:hypothetical protein